MHIYVDPEAGDVTGLIDWGDVQVGDPVWDLAITGCHLASPSEGILRVHHADSLTCSRTSSTAMNPRQKSRSDLKVLGSFYLAYRQAWVAKLGPGAGRPQPVARDAAQQARQTDRRIERHAIPLYMRRSGHGCVSH